MRTFLRRRRQPAQPIASAHVSASPAQVSRRSPPPLRLQASPGAAKAAQSAVVKTPFPHNTSPYALYRSPEGAAFRGQYRPFQGPSHHLSALSIDTHLGKTADPAGGERTGAGFSLNMYENAIDFVGAVNAIAGKELIPPEYILAISLEAVGGEASLESNPERGAQMGAYAYAARAKLQAGTMGKSERDSLLTISKAFKSAGLMLRVHHADDDQDGLPEYGLGLSIGLGAGVGLDFKTEDPIRTLLMAPLVGKPVLKGRLDTRFGASNLTHALLSSFRPRRPNASPV